jgi:hypothetical protein
MREMRQFELMRDALRHAVGPETRRSRRGRHAASDTTLRHTTPTGPVMRCPIHGEVEVADGAVECPRELLVMHDGMVGSGRCGERLRAW